MLNITRSITQNTDCTERKKEKSIAFATSASRALILEQGIACTIRLRCEGVETVALSCYDARSYSSWCENEPAIMLLWESPRAQGPSTRASLPR